MCIPRIPHLSAGASARSVALALLGVAASGCGGTDPSSPVTAVVPASSGPQPTAAETSLAGGDAPLSAHGLVPADSAGTPQADEAFLARCRAAADYSRSCDGEVVLVLRDGKPVFQDAERGFTVNTPHLLASGTKSFSGVAAALAMDDGMLSLDEYVSGTITEWKSDPRKSKVTVRQLLSLSSGLEPLDSTIDTTRNARAAGIRSRAEASISARTVAEPGQRFIYGPSSFYVFGELMKRKLAAAKTGDADVVAYLTRKAFAPLGISPRFMRDDVGDANLPGGCRLSATEWAVFGELVRNGGVHKGARLVSEASLSELMRPHGPRRSYGLTWWLLRDGADAEDPEDDTATGAAIGVMAAGKGKQRLYVLPGAGLTVVRFGPIEGSRRWRDREFLRILLQE